MIRRTVVGIALCAMALSACGDVSDSVDFTAPPGFVSKVAIGPFMQLWLTPDKKSVLMVSQVPGEVDISKAMNGADVKDAKIRKKEDITICGNQPAIFAELTGTSRRVTIGSDSGVSKGDNVNVDFVITKASGKSFFAVYVWPLHDAPDAAAQSAIRHLCAKKN